MKDNDHCLDCSGVRAKQFDQGSKLKDHDTAIIDLWKSVNSKIGVWWLLLIVPLLGIWLTFQGAMYDGIKNIQKDVAVIQTTLRLRNPDEHKGP